MSIECPVVDEGYQAGDLATVRLTVCPDGGAPTDATTTAEVELVSPTGQVRRPTAYPGEGDDRSRWSATLDLTEPGEWTGLWTVTGTGAGVQPFTLLVAPSGPYRGRSYATTADLAVWLHEAPPAGSARLLARATELVDALAMAAIYDVDEQGMPTSPEVADALRDAVCAQVAWWAEIGDSSGSGAVGRWSSVSIGTARLSGPRSSGSDHTSAADAASPETRRILRLAGLWANTVRVVP